MLSDLSCQSVCPVLSVTLVYFGQTVGWIMTPLGTEVSLGSAQVTFCYMRTQLHARKGAQQPPNCRAISIVSKRSPISATATLLLLVLLNPVYTTQPVVKQVVKRV